MAYPPAERLLIAQGLMKLLPAIATSTLSKGYYDEMGYPWGVCYDPPDLPIPCTPADLTPTMAVAMPAPMQADFCARLNALSLPVPQGAGMCKERAFSLALELSCEEMGWLKLADGSYARMKLEGGKWVFDEEIAKAGKVLSAANQAIVESARDALQALLDAAAPAVDNPVEKGAGFEGVNITFSKIDAELMQVFGYAYVAKTSAGDNVVDHSGDVADIEEMKKAIYASFGVVKSREMHKTDASAHMIESVWIDHEKLTKMGATPGDAPDGGWWFGMQVTDEALWKRIKSGELSAFSIGGAGQRTPV